MKYILLLFLVVIYSAANGQIITTIAGNDTAGFSGDGGPATAAKLHTPAHARPDGLGNVYIADGNNNRVRKVNIAGIITTIAGTGGSSSGDGGPATAAGMDGVSSVAIDSAGNIYLSENGSGTGPRIRKIDATGIITTFAGGGTGGDGGPATAAFLHGAADIAIDRAGNVYICESAGYIRKVDTAGIISTIAGNGTLGYSGDGGPATAAQLYQPYGVAADGLGNIYIADYINNRIRKVDTAGIITTIAGDSTYGYSGDSGPATAAALYAPSGVAADSIGNVYIADSYHGRVRRVDTAGIITTIAGDSTYGHSGDGGPATAAEVGSWGVALDRAGNIYVVEEYYNDVRKITAPPRVTEGVAPPGLPRGEELLTVYPNPNEGSYTVRVSSAANEAVQVVISNVMGQKVKEITAVTNKDIEVQTGSPPGIYFITAVTASGMESGRVVVR